jgi:D-methionine transport system permease protein
MTLATISYLSATTMAGAVGAGGLGAVALNYGYQSFNNTILYTSVLILCIMVQIIQAFGNYLYKKI